MAITFPRAFLHDLPIVGMSFIPMPMAEILPLRSGKRISADLGPTVWRATFSMQDLEDWQFGQARAWYGTLLSYREFYGYDKIREYPLAYKDGWPEMSPEFDGTCELFNADPGGELISLSGLFADFEISPGDYLSFDDDGDRRILVRASEAMTSDSAGDITDLHVHPPVPYTVLASPVKTVNLFRPTAKMTIVPGSYSESIQAPSSGSLSFEAIQTL
jgi:hypothetical protein